MRHALMSAAANLAAFVLGKPPSCDPPSSAPYQTMLSNDRRDLLYSGPIIDLGLDTTHIQSMHKVQTKANPATKNDSAIYH